MTDRPTRVVINCTTGEETIVELTDEEIATIAKAQADHDAVLAQKKAEAEAKEALRTAAITKLAALGLTEEEAAAIAGA